MRYFLRRHMFNSTFSRARITASVGMGTLLGLLPIWGFQGIAAIASAHFLRLSKILSFLCTRISIPPLAPFVIFAEYAVGSRLTGQPMRFSAQTLTLEEAMRHLSQYLLGSFVCAILAAGALMLLTYLLLLLFHRRKEAA